MKVASYIGLTAGLALMAALIVWQGMVDIANLLLASGWILLLVPLIWFPSVLMNARCWQLLFAIEHMPTFWQAFYAQWMGRSVNALLPVASIGGEVVKTRAVILWGIDARQASAAAIVDKTIQAVTIVLWGLLGVMLLAKANLDNRLVVAAAVGLAILGAGVIGFFIVQRAGLLGFIAKFTHRFAKSRHVGTLVETAGEIDRVVIELYRRRRRVAVAALWRLAALVYQTGEVWLAAYLLGHPVGLVEALLLKSLSNTLSDAAFVVPNGYGVQEGAFVVLGGLVGLSPEVSLALSLAIRIREIVFDVPGLVFWQHTEGRAFFRRRNSAREAAAVTERRVSSPGSD